MIRTVTCELQFPYTWSGTGSTESETISIEPCCLCEQCYVKQDKFWCNHCVDAYGIIGEIIQNNPGLPVGTLMNYCMKCLRGKISGVLCEKIIQLLKRKEDTTLV